MDGRDSEVAYLVFDIETIADGHLIQRLKYPDTELAAADAISQFQNQLLEEKGTDVVPWTFVLPISVAVAKVGRDFRLLDLTVLDSPHYRPHEITRKFWNGWSHYRRPTFVTFNGRGYDLPVMELCAYRYGLSIPSWFNFDARSFEQARNRYNTDSHIDLMDLLSNFGAARLNGGLNLLANILGKPGKTTVDGSMVQSLYAEGRVEEINDYCQCDVLDTYFVFLRSRVMTGHLNIGDEQELVTQTQEWLKGKAESSRAVAHYLEHWGDWEPPPVA